MFAFFRCESVENFRECVVVCFGYTKDDIVILCRRYSSTENLEFGVTDGINLHVFIFSIII